MSATPNIEFYPNLNEHLQNCQSSGKFYNFVNSFYQLV